MKRLLSVTAVVLLMTASSVRAEFLQMDLSIFGMD